MIIKFKGKHSWIPEKSFLLFLVYKISYQQGNLILMLTYPLEKQCMKTIHKILQTQKRNHSGNIKWPDLSSLSGCTPDGKGIFASLSFKCGIASPGLCDSKSPFFFCSSLMCIARKTWNQSNRRSGKAVQFSVSAEEHIWKDSYHHDKLGN